MDFFSKVINYVFTIIIELKITIELSNERHMGHDKTLTLIVNTYFLPTMRHDVCHYIETCHIFQVSKGTAINIGLYMPLQIRTQNWANISMDVVLGLPYIQRGINLILIIVNRF